MHFIEDKKEELFQLLKDTPQPWIHRKLIRKIGLYAPQYWLNMTLLQKEGLITKIQNGKETKWEINA
jgi:hypothetical protein